MFESILEVEVRIPLIVSYPVGVLIMLWALASGLMAFRGGITSGLPHILPPAAPATPAAPAAEKRTAVQEETGRAFRFGQVANFLLAGAAMTAMILMIVGMILA